MGFHLAPGVQLLELFYPLSVICAMVFFSLVNCPSWGFRIIYIIPVGKDFHYEMDDPHIRVQSFDHGT